MAGNGLRPHFKLVGVSATSAFATPQSGRANFVVAKRNRREHGRELLRQLRAVTPAAQERIAEQHRISDAVPSGIYLQFDSEPGFELASESFARERSGIELLSVVQEGNLSVATVFVPEGKLPHFETLVRAYLESQVADTEEGKPRHQRLINNIARIRLATMRSLWTDHPDLYPQDVRAPVWWEVWLRVGTDREAFVALFREHGTRLGLQVHTRELRFLERTVVAARGSPQQLTRSVELLNCIAELRRLKSTAGFFVDLRPAEQWEWLEETLGRIAWPEPNAPAVCLLDTGVTREHPLLAPAILPNDTHTILPAWGTADVQGHGTQMAGLALYGDLVDLLSGDHHTILSHRCESVKLLNLDGDNEGELYGDLCREAIGRAEIAAPDRNRTICLAVTAKEDIDRGKPSSWSATVDALAAGSEDDVARLIVVSAGNTDPDGYSDYPESNTTDSIHDPAQAWNALTVGAVTFKNAIDEAESPGWLPLAEQGDLSPYSCTSSTWEPGWPVKPDVVFEGGNLGRSPTEPPSGFAELDLLSTYHQPAIRPFDLMWATSASAALASGLGARIQARYPALWPETVRGLIVHSANWTPAMLARYRPELSRNNTRVLLQQCGHGVPSEQFALFSGANALTLIVEDELRPFEAVLNARGSIDRMRAREMRLHSLPWPITELNDLGALEVELSVTLSYFIEPNPSARGWTRRYLYESHGLRFDVKRAHEDETDFIERINLRARAEDDRQRHFGGEDDGWMLGPRLRHLGSIHSDRWRGTATDLAARGRIAVYPTMGWWRERRIHERWGKSARYALLVSISTPESDVDLYAAIQALIGVPVEIPAR